MIQIGDDITISGVVTFIKDNYVMIKTSTHDEIWVKIDDVKTHRPKMEVKNE